MNPRTIGWAAVWCAAMSPALAFEDPATGFAVRTRRPFLVTPSDRPQFDVGVGLDDADGRIPIAGTGRHLCEAGFKAAPQNASLTQTQINAVASAPEWRNLVKSTFELGFKVTAIRNVRIANVVGAEIEAIPKTGPGAADARAYATLHETPKGRVTLVCVTTAKAYPKALASFRAVRDAITPPK
jgi:protein TonB